MIAAVRAEPKPHGFWQRADGKGKDSTVISPTRDEDCERNTGLALRSCGRIFRSWQYRLCDLTNLRLDHPQMEQSRNFGALDREQRFRFQLEIACWERFQTKTTSGYPHTYKP